ncbi:MAG: hypothetical protein JWM10_3746, partial [Myxococcaceae bacterium]|nr:hypothetical protein [Myxococcaceae bacterium]
VRVPVAAAAVAEGVDGGLHYRGPQPPAGEPKND